MPNTGLRGDNNLGDRVAEELVLGEENDDDVNDDVVVDDMVVDDKLVNGAPLLIA